MFSSCTDPDGLMHFTLYLQLEASYASLASSSGKKDTIALCKNARVQLSYVHQAISGLSHRATPFSRFSRSTRSAAWAQCVSRLSHLVGDGLRDALDPNAGSATRKDVASR